MPRGVVIRPGKFNRQPQNYLVITVISQKTGKWEHLTRRLPYDLPLPGYIVLCPTPQEARECVRYVGPRLGLLSTTGFIDDQWEQWVLGRYLQIEHYGRPKGYREMLYAEFVRGWYPGLDLINRGCRSSPGITDGVLEPEWESRHPSAIAAAIASSMG